jgi:hypothetical protein
MIGVMDSLIQETLKAFSEIINIKLLMMNVLQSSEEWI